MMNKLFFSFKLALFLTAVLVMPASSQQVGEIERSDDKSATWWERVTNRHEWLRKGLGKYFKFEKSIGVIIAIGNYTGEFDDLASPVNDAARMRDFLINEAAFDEVHMLVNASATSANIRTVMERRIPELVGENDRLLVYWSGHGGSAKDANDRSFGFLALQDGTKDGRIGTIYMDEAKRWLRRVKARQVLFVVDACYSGLSLQMANAPSEPRWEQLSRPAHHMLTSSSDEQVSYGYSDGTGGLFTTAFIEGAGGAADNNKDGLSTITEIANYIEDNLRSVTSFGFEQTPQFGSIGRQEGRFFFPNGNRPLPSPTLEENSVDLEETGDKCSAAIADYEVFVRSARECWEVEFFLKKYSGVSSCNVVEAATHQINRLCSVDSASASMDPCSLISSPDGFKCVPDVDGRATIVREDAAKITPTIELSPTIADKNPLVGELEIYYDDLNPGPKAAFEDAVSAFRNANPGIDVNVSITDREAHKTSIRSLLLSGSPDIVSWYPGNRMAPFVKAGLFEDVSALWAAEGLDESMASMKDAMTLDGKQWGVPYTYYQWGIYYRKDIFDGLGIEPPLDWESLLFACAKLRNAGIVPFTIGTEFHWTTAAVFDYLNLRINGYEVHNQLTNGEIAYSDPRIRLVFEKWKQLIESEYFIENHSQMSWQEALSPFISGDAAMYVMGNFVVDALRQSGLADSQIGFFPFPTINPSIDRAEEAPADALFIPSNAKNKRNALEFLAFVSQAEVQSKWNSWIGQLPVNGQSSVESEDKFLKTGFEMLRTASAVSQFYDRDTPPEMARAGMEGFHEFMVNPDRLERIVNRLDQVQERVYR